MSRQSKSPPMRPDGRSDVKDFNEVFSKSLKVGVVVSPAFRSLTSSSKSVAFVFFAKNDHAKYHKRKDADGKPVFEFQRHEALLLLGMNNRTFLDALNQLRERGFIEDSNPDNPSLKSSRGTPNQYRLCNRWKQWRPEPTAKELMQTMGEDAPADLKAKIEQRRVNGLCRLGRMQQPAEPVRKSSPVKQQFSEGQKVGFYKDESAKRAVYGYVVSRIVGGWKIWGLRTSKEFNPPSYEIPENRVVPIEYMKSRANTKRPHSEQKPGEKILTPTREKVRAMECTG